MKRMKVTIKPGLSHSVRHFGGEVVEVTEDEFNAFGDKFIVPAIDATPEAWELAEQKGLDMRAVDGSGKGGKILIGDVRALVDGSSES